VTTLLVQLEADSSDARPFASELARFTAGPASSAEHVPSVEVRFVTGDAMLACAPEAEIVVCDELDDAFVAAAVKLRWVSFWGAGLETRVTPALAARRDVRITNASGVHGPNIAEHVLALILAHTRRLPVYLRAQTERTWMHPTQYTEAGIDELYGRTVGIVGLGRIGEAIAARARPFGVRVVAVKSDPAARHDPSVAVDAAYGPEGLDDVLAESDHVVVALPLTPRTRRLMDAGRIARMKRTAYLYNVGRGAVIDEAALVRALVAGEIAGAGLDVTEAEPLPRESPLWAMPNVIVTPHVSGITPRYFERVARLVAENVTRYLRGEPLANQYVAERGY
jgi:phosphoglycerate dehydrogenase-like enzyme